MVRKDAAPGDAIPPAVEWQGPMCWTGSPLRPIGIYSRPCPADTVFVRGELVFTITEMPAPGLIRQSEKAVPGLIRLDRSQPVEVHAPGLDAKCWTYRRVKVGRKWRWALFTGATFPGENLSGPGTGQDTIERIVVQSILPMADNRHVCFVIDPEGDAENLAAATDPDPEG